MKEDNYKYYKEDIDNLKKTADIRDIIPGLTSRGASRSGTCPKCGVKKAGKGLVVTYKPKDGKNCAHCFSCGFHLSDPVSAYMFYENVGFLEAVEAVAGIAHFHLREKNTKGAKAKDPGVKKPVPSDARRPGQTVKPLSFCAKQLEQSGLTPEDVTARWVMPDGSVVYKPTFTSGGLRSDHGSYYNDVDDEMLIHYLDLEGSPVQFLPKNSKQLKPYIRVRWSNPFAHVDKDGKPYKYMSPKGSSLKLYIPQAIRTKYLKGEKFDTLFIQEGEKKAEKACKHGILSVAIQGISMIGSEQIGLIADIQYLVKQCGIKNIVMVMDSDWDNLSSSLEDSDAIDTRPKQFAAAVIKFKTYAQTLDLQGLHVDTYWGHINKNEAKEKGMDDLLVGTLKGKEDDLLSDIMSAMKTHDGKGQYADIHKISTLSDLQVRKFWSLDNKEEFFKRYEERISQLQRFRFGSIAYIRTESGEIKAAGTVGEKIWSVECKESGERTIKFEIISALDMLRENGFRIFFQGDNTEGDFKVVRVVDQIVETSSGYEVRSFLFDFVMQNSKDKEVHAKFATSLGKYMGQSQIERMDRLMPDFDNPVPNKYTFRFKNCQVDVSPHSIAEIPPVGLFWREKAVLRNFKKVELLKRAEKNSDGIFQFESTPDGDRCEFLQFLIDTCTPSGKDRSELSSEEMVTLYHHLMNKLTCIGYLLCDYKYPSENKTIVAMDSRISEVGESKGRSGKSLIGVALRMMQPIVSIDGRRPGVESDDFLLSEVTSRTRSIMIDDVRARFDYERLFNLITDEMSVNPKGLARFKIPQERSPKFYITTNHAISSQSDSASARIATMSFSDFYNKDFQPIDKFGHHFFSEWDNDQWNLFLNLMVLCAHLYMKSMALGWQKKGSGIVEAPQQNIQLRNLRQIMGEGFFQWAELKFDPLGDSINRRLDRKELHKDYHDQYPGATYFTPPTIFRKKMEAFCEYSGLHLNPSRPHKESGVRFSDWRKANPESASFIGDADKSNGKEFFTVATSAWADVQPF